MEEKSMDSSIKINSISIDLSDAAKKIDEVKCNHFSIRGYAAKAREIDLKKSWPFSEETFSLVELTLPPISVPNFRWHGCWGCTRDDRIDQTTKDCEHSNSRTISEMNLDGNSSVIPNKSLAVVDHEKIAGNVVVENEDVNSGERIENEENENVNGERIENDDHTTAQTNAAKKVRPRSNVVVENEDVNSGERIENEENENVNGERIENDDHTTAQTNAAKKVRPRSKDAPKVRSKSRKLASSKKVGKKKPREKVKKPTLGEIADVLEDTPPKAIKKRKGRRGVMESDNVSSGSRNISKSRSPGKRTGKSRLLSQMFDEGNTKTSGDGSNIRKEDSSSKRETVRGRKRKLLPDQSSFGRRVLSKTSTTSENASKTCDESTDSETDRDPIKGKKKNRRFQIVDEFVPSLSQEGIPENDADPGKAALSSPVQSNEKDSVPCPLSTTQITEKKKKKLSLSKKKKKKPVTHDKKSKLLSVRAGVDKGKQVKARTGRPPVNAVSQSTQDLLDEEMAAEGYFRKSIPQKINDKQVLQDNDLLKTRDAEANCLREFGSSSKPNNGESLRTGVDVVDFSYNNNNTNRSISPNSTLIRHTSSPTEVADLSCLLQKDASGADRKGKAVMVQEHHEASNHTKENTPEDQNDEIPMDIVELMAKNQYERCLPDTEEDVNNEQPSQERPHKSKNALMIDLNETYDNGTSQEDNITTRYPKPSDSNARNEEHFPIRKQQPSLEFFPISQPYVPASPFGIFPPPTQENRASSIQWLGNVPTMANQNPSPSPSPFRVLRGCNTCQSVPHHQHREASHLVWPPPVIHQQCHHHHHHHTPVSFNMYQSTKPDTFSQASNNGNAWNLNFVAPNGKQICGSNSEFSFGCKHTGGRTMERFPSESAFHLHSRMDPRLNSNIHTDHSKFPKRHFPPVNQAKEFIELQRGDSSKAAYPTNQSPFHFQRPETSRNSFPIIPSSFSFQNPQASWSQYQEKETTRKDTFPPAYNNSHVFGSSNDQGRFQLLGASNSMMQPLKSHMTDNEKNQKRKAEDVKNASALPQKKSSELLVCSVNKNPADFTIPEAGNVYMLKGEDLKVIRKRVTYKRKSSLCKQDALKQTKKPVCSATENA